MAWITARTENGSGDRLTPSRALKSSLARSRSRITPVMSISTAAVSWALVASEATIRSAMTLRSRVAGVERGRLPRWRASGRLGLLGRRRLAVTGPGGRPGGLLAAPLEVGLDVLAAHPPARPAALDLAQVDVVLAGEPAHQRRHDRPLGPVARDRRGRPGLLGAGLLAAPGSRALVLGLHFPRGLGLRLGLAARPGAAARDDGQLGADLDGLVLLDLDRLQDAGHRGGDLGVDLVGGHLEQRLVRLDPVALLLQPAGDGALGDRLAELGHPDWCRHHRRSL